MDKNFKKGFTLAEILIVLGAIGVVAALTLPTLISNIHNKVVERQIQVINRKINKGSEGMQINGALLKQYSTTQEFLEELSKYMKIIATCNKNNLRNCWPYGEIKVEKDGEIIPIDITTQTQGGPTFQVEGDNYGDVMGVIFGNGVPMLMTYNTECPMFDPDSTYEVDKLTGKGPISQCIVGVYDINGASGPNKYGVDVIPFNANGYGGRTCWFKTSSNACFTGMYVPSIEQAKSAGSACSNIVNSKEYVDESGLFGSRGKTIKLNTDLNLGDTSRFECMDKDFWLASLINCSAQGMRLPKDTEIIEFMKDIFGENFDNSNWTHDTIAIAQLPQNMQLLYSVYGGGYSTMFCDGYGRSKTSACNFTVYPQERYGTSTIERAFINNQAYRGGYYGAFCVADE